MVSVPYTTSVARVSNNGDIKSSDRARQTIAAGTKRCSMSAKITNLFFRLRSSELVN